MTAKRKASRKKKRPARVCMCCLGRAITHAQKGRPTKVGVYAGEAAVLVTLSLLLTHGQDYLLFRALCDKHQALLFEGTKRSVEGVRKEFAR